MIFSNYKLRISFLRKVAILFLVSILFQISFPTIAFALTGGPSQPEFSTFSSVETTNMVNEFTGDFSYNIPVISIPGVNGSGYAMSLNYTAGGSSEQEASWVGYGWNLNAGAVTRNKNGIPDDVKGENTTYFNQGPASITTAASLYYSQELVSVDKKVLQDLTPSGNIGFSMSNHSGFNANYGLGLAWKKGVMALNYFQSAGKSGFSASVSPLAFFSKKENSKEAAAKEAALKDAEKKLESLREDKSKDNRKERREARKTRDRLKGKNASGIGRLSFSSSNYPLSTTSYSGISTNVSLGLPIGKIFGYNHEAGVSGSYTWQKSTPEVQNNVFGSMYLNDANNEDIQDYSVEKWSGYEKRDKYLGIPKGNEDVFSVQAEGLQNNFELVHKKSGIFRPNKVHSELGKVNIDVDINVGPTSGIGFGAGGGYHHTTEQGWYQSIISNTPFTSGDDESDPVFKVKGELSGQLLSENYESIERASLIRTNGTPGDKQFRYGEVVNELNPGHKRIKRNNFLEVNTHEKQRKTSNNKRVVSNTKGKHVYVNYNFEDPNIDLIENGNTLTRGIDESQDNIDNKIGEITNYATNGNKYTFGLPVYSKGEANISYGLKNASIENNFIVTEDINQLGNNDHKKGYKADYSYASQFLITSITTPNYLDIDQNGPSDNDFGGWVKFNYDRVFGNDNKYTGGTWYKWRSPYSGLLYNRGSLSTTLDDNASVSYGEKEIYYLCEIETNTHLARFFTSDRTDARSADNNVNASKNINATGTGGLKKLDKIVLYKKLSDGSLKEQKRVHFEYETDPSKQLCQGLPNAESGKLTLKRVWMEYNGVYSAKISPYIFHYDYLKSENYPQHLKDKYPDVTSFADNFDNENPDYSQFSLDAWGNYQEDGENRRKDMINGLDQTPRSQFDPAVWQLKRIQLPTGGQIHVQYEQDDYSFVQDQNAQQLVKLTSADNEEGIYELDLSEYNYNATQLEALKNKIKKEYVSQELNEGGDASNFRDYGSKKRIFFKFLYKLIGTELPQIEDCRSEYITGYTTIDSVYIEDNKIRIKLLKGNDYKYNLPSKVCKEFYLNNRKGILNEGDCSVNRHEEIDDSKAREKVQNLISFNEEGIGGVSCKTMDPQMSYFRIPVLHKKLGGGLRVKRLLTYDKGLEAGDEVLYGVEYDYSDENNALISSGVATNEPGVIREENPLVQFVERNNQNWLSKAIVGRDRKEYEGPYGESFLPSASVGYARVKKRNIHQGKSSSGVVITNYHTFKDEPINLKPELTASTVEKKRDNMLAPFVVVNHKSQDIWLSQGWLFNIHNIHGKIKSQITKAGNINSPNEELEQTSEIRYEYYDPLKPVQVVDENGNLKKTHLGAEERIYQEAREIIDQDHSIFASGDIDAAFAVIILPWFSFAPSYSHISNNLRTHITTKVVHYPYHLKSVTTTIDNVTHTETNLAFSTSTGAPVVTDVTDEYHKIYDNGSIRHLGNYTKYAIEGLSKYPEIGHKYANQGLEKEINVKMISNKLVAIVPSPETVTQSSDYKEFVQRFYNGDLLEIEGNTSNYFNVVGLTYVHVDGQNQIAIKAAINSNYTMEHEFDDNLVYADLKILKSGRTNQLATEVGSATTYSTIFSKSNNDYKPSLFNTWKSDMLGFNIDYNTEDIDHISNQYKENTINASAITLKDDWDFNSNCELQEVFDAYDHNPYQTGVKGNWMTHQSFVYDSKIVQASGDKKVQDLAGVYANNEGIPYFEPFNWSNPDNSDLTSDWKWTNEIMEYDHNFNPIEAKNRLGIYQSEKFIENTNLVYINANNAQTQDILFESFETKLQACCDNTDENCSRGENGEQFKNVVYKKTNGTDNVNNAHSGNYVLRGDFNESFDFKFSKLTNQVKENGLKLVFWAHMQVGDEKEIVPELFERHSQINLVKSDDNTVVRSFDVKATGMSEMWGQLMVNIDDFSGLNFGDSYHLSFTSKNPPLGAPEQYIKKHAILTSQPYYLDDLKVVPANSSSACYVYDEENRLITSFNDQHFGMYYRYDQEGRLSKKIIETSRGKRMVSEQNTNTPKVDRINE